MNRANRVPRDQHMDFDDKKMRWRQHAAVSQKMGLRCRGYLFSMFSMSIDLMRQTMTEGIPFLSLSPHALVNSMVIKKVSGSVVC